MTSERHLGKLLEVRQLSNLPRLAGMPSESLLKLGLVNSFFSHVACTLVLEN